MTISLVFLRIFANENHKRMKVKLTKSQIAKLAENPDSKVELSDPWWVIVLKVIVYVSGLILAGIGTTEAATRIAMLM